MKKTLNNILNILFWAMLVIILITFIALFNTRLDYEVDCDELNQGKHVDFPVECEVKGYRDR